MDMEKRRKNISHCDMCKSKEIIDGLKWENKKAIKFDDATQEILIEEDLLMHYIQLANPLQQKRKIRLINSILKE